MERVGVLHDELARAHHAEARANLVAELGLDLIEIDRQLLVAAQLAARDVGDHFLMGRTVREFAVVPILEAQQLRPVFGPAAGFLPQFCRLNCRHDELQGARPVHLLAHDPLDLFQRLRPIGSQE